MKTAGLRHRLRARRERRRALRAAQRAARPRGHELPRSIDSPLEFVRAIRDAGVRKSIAFDERGNALEVEIDPERFAAEIARLEADPAMQLDLDQLDDADSFTGDDNCPICIALRNASIGEPRRTWSLD